MEGTRKIILREASQTQKDITQRVRDLGTLIPKWDVSIKSLPSELGEHHRRGGRKTVRPKGWRAPREQDHLTQHEQISYELIETEAACTGPAQVCTRASPFVLWLPG